MTSFAHLTQIISFVVFFLNILANLILHFPLNCSAELIIPVVPKLVGHNPSGKLTLLHSVATAWGGEFFYLPAGSANRTDQKEEGGGKHTLPSISDNQG